MLTAAVLSLAGLLFDAEEDFDLDDSSLEDDDFLLLPLSWSFEELLLCRWCLSFDLERFRSLFDSFEDFFSLSLSLSLFFSLDLERLRDLECDLFLDFSDFSSPFVFFDFDEEESFSGDSSRRDDL